MSGRGEIVVGGVTGAAADCPAAGPTASGTTEAVAGAGVGFPSGVWYATTPSEETMNAAVADI
jgi:hypothetical protein